MLVSNRFTNAITQTTRDRLARVMNNSRPITRRERNRGAVVAIQSALSDLNQGYMVSAEVDGFFGSKSAAAVEAFQRDYGLFADGIVGRQTLTELDQIFSGELFRTPQGMSIHVGVNFVDAAHYGGTFPLAACVNDANDFQDVAQSLGYTDVLLTNEQATTANFTAAMRQAATNLFSGDALFVTFSGHGSQLTNTSSDEEADMLDETLCFYDRMLIDDEVFALLQELRPGVQVTMLYDSCHSATVTRMLVVDDADDFKARNMKAMTRRVSSYDPEVADGTGEDEAADEKRFVPYEPSKLSKALDGDRAEQVSRAPIADETVADIVEALSEINSEIQGAEGKFLRDFDAIYTRNAPLYDAIKSVVGQREQGNLECHVVAFSACQDNQTTLDGSVNGLYSGNVLSAWAGGGYSGSVRQLHSHLVDESPANITPALHTYGGPRAEARLNEKPFAF